jgi:hypothetical protein
MRYFPCSIERGMRSGRVVLSGTTHSQDHRPNRTTQKNENILPFPERYFSFRAKQDGLIVACTCIVMILSCSGPCCVCVETLQCQLNLSKRFSSRELQSRCVTFPLGFRKWTF